MKKFQIKHNLKQLLIAVDQLFNVLICSVMLPKDKVWADETISSHAWRWDQMGLRSWPKIIIDWLALFFGDKNHCYQSFESERLGRQLPPEARAEFMEQE